MSDLRFFEKMKWQTSDFKKNQKHRAKKGIGDPERLWSDSCGAAAAD